MTANQINNRKVEEESRANRAKEGLEKRKQNLDAVNSALNRRNNTQTSIIKGASGLVSKVLNDPSWYNLDKQLVTDVASLPSGIPLGTKISLGNSASEAIPGIMELDFIPTFSGDGSAASALNLAAKNVYSYVRHANSGSKNYDAPDLMNYLMSVSSVYSLIEQCKRAYRISRTFSSANRYMGNALLNASINKKDVRELLDSPANYRYRINRAIQRVNSFYVPDVFPIYKRHMFLTSTVFCDDAKSNTNQLYIFRQEGAWEYNELAGSLDYLALKDPAGAEAASIITRVEQILNAMTASEDIGVMSGDILKAYGASACVLIKQLGEDETQEIGYSEEVLNQIHNASVLPVTSVAHQYNDSTKKYENYTLAVYQDLKGNIHQGYVRYNSTGTKVETVHSTLGDALMIDTKAPSSLYVEAMNTFMSKAPLNLVSDEINPDIVMVATRLRVQAIRIYDDQVSATETVHEGLIPSALMGSEMVTRAYIFSTADDDTGKGNFTSYYLNADTGNVHLYALSISSKRAAFDWAPMAWVIMPTNAAQNQFKVYPMNIDWNTLVLANPDAILAMHTVAVLSEYGCPVNAVAPRVKG